jgi:acetylglutamate kinase
VEDRNIGKQTGEALQEAFPYIRYFRGKTVLIKAGGSALEGDELQEQITVNIALLKHLGVQPVIVHGGGKAVTGMLSRTGCESRFDRGLRVTDPETMEITEMVLSGSVNKELSARLCRHGAPAAGISGRDGHLFSAARRNTDQMDLDRVGTITSVQPHLLYTLTNAGYIPVISPVSADPEGTVYNINADDAAVAAAVALKADTLIFLTDVPGILKVPGDPGSLLPLIEARDARRLIDNGTIAGGMIPKTEAALSALEGGVGAVRILDGTLPRVLLRALFSPEKTGTTIRKEPDY